MVERKLRLVEVYGSLLKSKQREKEVKKGIMKEIGKVERRGWKLSFDRKSTERQEAVLNFVHTGNPEDVYYTTVYEVDDNAYVDIMEREMGEQTAKIWKQGKRIGANNYRPIQLDSEFGKTEIFIIPDEGRKITKTNWEAGYVKTVRDGIEESYKDKPIQIEANLKALKRAVEESKTT